MMNPEEMLMDEVQEPESLTDLSWMGRAIRDNNRKIENFKNFCAKELEKIKACSDRAIEKLEEDNHRLEGMASGVMKAHDYSYDDKNMRKYQMQGIGVFRFRITRESVDTHDYDMFDEDARLEAQEKFPDGFKTKVTISPDKKVIADTLKGGNEVWGFKLKPKFEKFEFKGE